MLQTDTKKTKTIVCTKCGATYAAEAKVCGADGTLLDESMTPTVVIDRTKAAKVCPQCNATYPSYALFCPGDATRLVSIDKGSESNASGIPTPSTHTSASAVIAAVQTGGVRDTRAVPSNAGPTTDDGTVESVLAGDGNDALIGRTFAGKYRIDSMVGEGGMARVYLATHLEIQKPVVIKLMHNNLSPKERATSLKRFEQEIKVTARLDHPNLVSVFDGGEISGRPYLVMEYIKGDSLRTHIINSGALDFKEAIAIVSQACAGLSEAHNQGIVHRDLKPENIMLREQSNRPDWVKVVDFGIAHLKQGGSKLTATGIAVGTVDYMSPEYLQDKPIDHRADIYALGIMLYELLTAHCPFEGESCEAILTKHLFQRPMPPSSVRTDMQPGCALDVIVERALEKEPEARYQSTMEMRKALLAALNNPNG